jgi:hypothetical protein
MLGTEWEVNTRNQAGIGCENVQWIKVPQDRIKWRTYMITVMTRRVP